MKMLHAEIKAYKDSLNECNALLDYSKFIDSFGDRNFTNVNRHKELRISIESDISLRVPFSLIRLGDGEGNILFWGLRNKFYPEVSALCMDRIWKLMFGRNDTTTDSWDLVYDQLVESINNARYIGVPTVDQFNSRLSAINESNGVDDSLKDIRGTIGVVGVGDWMISASIQSVHNSVLVNWHVHNSIITMYGDLIKKAGNINLITCYSNLQKLLVEKTGANAGVVYLIPPQAANIKSTPTEKHFPSVYNNILKEIRNSNLEGNLFFVGAGILGKIYCNEIMKSGGMAIDVGSLMDVWVGNGVRPYQNQNYVDAHKI